MRYLIGVSVIALLGACAAPQRVICDREAQEWTKFGTQEDECARPPVIVATNWPGGGESDGGGRDVNPDVGSPSDPVGDVLVQLSTGSLWEVTALNSKCRSPSQSKNGFYKLEGKRL